MKIPRDLTGPELVHALRRLGYVTTRQSGSHIRVTTQVKGERHEVIPNHRRIKVGTLRGILRNVAGHHGMNVPELIEFLEL